MTIQNKKVAHNSSNTSFLNCCPEREKEGKLFELSHYPLLPHASPPKQPAEIGFKQLLTAAFLLCKLWSCTLLKLFALRSHKISQLLPYSYLFHSCIHTPGAFNSLVLSGWLRHTRSKLLPVIVHRNRQRIPGPNAMLHQEGSDNCFSGQLCGNYRS